MCVVGEWDGDTGSPALTAALQHQFCLVQRVALPNWTDTAHELTVWERNSSHSPATAGAASRAAGAAGGGCPSGDAAGRSSGLNGSCTGGTAAAVTATTEGADAEPEQTNGSPDVLIGSKSGEAGSKGEGPPLLTCSACGTSHGCCGSFHDSPGGVDGVRGSVLRR